MTETWTARAKLSSLHVPLRKMDVDGDPSPWNDEEERKLRLSALELKRGVLEGTGLYFRGNGRRSRGGHTISISE
jgi:hypothetical protein